VKVVVVEKTKKKKKRGLPRPRRREGEGWEKSEKRGQGLKKGRVCNTTKKHRPD